MQPYYVIDRTRKSLDAEMRIPNNVREACRNREKPLKGMCALPILFEESEISADSAISYTVLRLNEKHHLGDQYDWLARLAKQLGISNLEICIHKQDNAHSFLENNVELREARPNETYAMHTDAEPDLKILFGDHRFPLLDLSKPE